MKKNLCTYSTYWFTEGVWQVPREISIWVGITEQNTTEGECYWGHKGNVKKIGNTSNGVEWGWSQWNREIPVCIIYSIEGISRKL